MCLKRSGEAESDGERSEPGQGGHGGPGRPRGGGCFQWGLLSNVPLLLRHPQTALHKLASTPPPLCFFCIVFVISYVIFFPMWLLSVSPNENVSFTRPVLFNTPLWTSRTVACSWHPINISWMSAWNNGKSLEMWIYPHTWPSPFLPFSNTYLMNTYCVPGAVLRVGNIAVPKDRRSSAPWSLHLIGSHAMTKNYTFQELALYWFNSFFFFTTKGIARLL